MPEPFSLRVHVLGISVIVIIVQVLGKYMIILGTWTLRVLGLPDVMSSICPKRGVGYRGLGGECIPEAPNPEHYNMSYSLKS